jgi:hypothetical protein
MHYQTNVFCVEGFDNECEKSGCQNGSLLRKGPERFMDDGATQAGRDGREEKETGFRWRFMVM